MSQVWVENCTSLNVCSFIVVTVKILDFFNKQAALSAVSYLIDLFHTITAGQKNLSHKRCVIKLY